MADVGNYKKRQTTDITTTKTQNKNKKTTATKNDSADKTTRN